MQGRSSVRFGHLLLLCLSVLLLLPLLFLQDGLLARLCSRLFIFGSCALALDFFLLSCKEACLCAASFLGLGAYAAALSARGGSSPFILLLSFTAALCLPLLLSLLFGALLMRLEGELFSLATFCLSEAIRVFLEGTALAGGARGFDRLFLPNLPFSAALFLLCALLFCLCLKKSAFGLWARGAAAEPAGALACGISVAGIRLTSFCLMAVICGGAGFFYCGMTGFLLPADFSYLRGCDFLAAVVLGGMGSLIFPVLGAMAIALSELYLSGLAAFRLVLMGSLFLLAVRLPARKGRRKST